MILLLARLICEQSSHMPVRGPVSNLHLDILKGTDEYLETKDLFLPGASHLTFACTQSPRTVEADKKGNAFPHK